MPIYLDQHLVLGDSELLRPSGQVSFAPIDLTQNADEDMLVRLQYVCVGWRAPPGHRYREGAPGPFASPAFHGVRSLPLNVRGIGTNFAARQRYGSWPPAHPHRG